MPLLARLSSLWRNLFRKARRERELTEEIDAYLEMLIEQKVNEGLNPAEARRAALIEFGGREQVKEKVREARAGHWLESIWQDLRYALRMLLKHPVFTLIAVFTLALGIGANSAVFSVVNAVLLRPLPFPYPERLLMVMGVRAKTGAGYDFSYLNFADYRSRNTVFEALTAFSDDNATLLEGESPERISGLIVSADFFRALGADMQIGRGFTTSDEQP